LTEIGHGLVARARLFMREQSLAAQLLYDSARKVQLVREPFRYDAAEEELLKIER
jgi:hypothetical protein